KNGVYGFMNMFFKMISEVKPKYIGVAFDLKAPTFRHKMYDGYKATRKPMPEELRPQIPLLKDLLKQMGIAVFEKEGFEADDIIGTIAKATNIDTYIYTGDRDSFQLVDSETSVCFTKRGITDIDLLNSDNFTEKTGITPKQIIELKALMGDASDNIPGIAGVGEKTAISLLQTYKDIDGVYNNIDKITGKLQEKIINGKESCYLSKTLATIDINAPIDTDIKKMEYSFPFSNDIKKRFIELEFKSLISRNEIFIEISNEQKEFSSVNSEIIEVTAENIFGITFGKELSVILSDEVVCIYDIKSGKEYQFKINVNLLDMCLTNKEIIEKIKPIFDKEYSLILFSKKDTKKKLKNENKIELNAEVEDVSLIKYLVDFTGKESTVKELLLENFGVENLSATALY
ncbi:MAG: DNA polymerase I, partial [Firmicutes bacterium]|nr:DNA polymerase I [Candidatus Caballimonas caccae]